MQEEVGIVFNTYEGGIVLSYQDRHKSALSMMSHPNMQKTEMAINQLHLNMDEESKSVSQINEEHILDLEDTQRNFLE